MNILYLTTEWPSAERPTDGIFIREHAASVASKCSVAVVHIARLRGEDGLYDIAPIPGETFPAWRVRYRRFPRPFSFAAFVLGAFAGMRRVRRDGLDPDVIHAHSPLSSGLAVMLGFVYRKPIVYTEHWTIFIPENPGRLARIQRTFTKVALRRASSVLPVSDDLRAALAELEPSAHFRVIHNVVDDRVFYPPAAREPAAGRPCRLLTTGLLDTGRKGVDILIEAIARLAQERTGFHLDVIGEGQNRPAYEALARRLGVDGLVTFHGFKPKAEVAEFMRAADLFVLASRFENQPCVLVEAMASGLPVVATAVGGVPETVDERSGVLVEPLDPEAFALAIAEALDGLDRFDRAGIARRAVEDYGRERIGGELLEVYAEASQ